MASSAVVSAPFLLAFSLRSLFKLAHYPPIWLFGCPDIPIICNSNSHGGLPSPPVPVKDKSICSPASHSSSLSIMPDLRLKFQTAARYLVQAYSSPAKHSELNRRQPEVELASHIESQPGGDKRSDHMIATILHI
ncbi:hypothetical protein JAAARDRAFT_41946 [Jaapia argillacea MUCL 33604]|uniref:Uncharacterized protein n=1 Tax=Jaapia argillacea MUCL 33604 TaxID=933084 RepID=A0A067P6W1_9AGAM|nr:hypothetical protein JAAARDRAFT_41946 [Jaapia argillacea MUCL 33604]